MLENEERIITAKIEPQDSGSRLDSWLSSRFTYHSRVEWQQLIKDGRILVDNKKCRCSKKVKSGEKIKFIPDPAIIEPEVDMSYQTVFEDEYILIINKPGNLPCHPAGRFFKNTLWYDLKKKYAWISVVNRLDRETSGLVITAKSSKAAAKFANLFTDGIIQKKYLALVFGVFKREVHAKGFLIADQRSDIRKKRSFVKSVPNENTTAESAETYFQGLATNGSYSLVEAIPKTGRLHQLRATLFSLGFPLLGDKLYGPDEQCYLKFVQGAMTDKDRKKLILPRQALHAYGLEFKHFFTKQKLKFEIGVPKDMICIYSKIKNGYLPE